MRGERILNEVSTHRPFRDIIVPRSAHEEHWCQVSRTLQDTTIDTHSEAVDSQLSSCTPANEVAHVPHQRHERRWQLHLAVKGCEAHVLARGVDHSPEVLIIYKRKSDVIHHAQQLHPSRTRSC